MFVRWKNRTLAARNGAGRNDRSFYAVVVKNQRIDGRTKQKVVKYLAHINESEIDLLEHREHFWRRVDNGLAELDLSPEDRAEIEVKLAGVVRRPRHGGAIEKRLEAPPDDYYGLDSLRRMSQECEMPAA